MIAFKYLALVVFIAMCLALMTLPFIPAYQEWKHPSDSAALPVSVNYENDIDYFAKRLHASVTTKLNLGADAGGKEIDFAPKPEESTQWINAKNPLVSQGSIETALPICSAQPLYVDGNIKTGEDSHFSELYATGDIELGVRSKITNWAHADGTLQLAAKSVAVRRVSAGSVIALQEGVWFERLNAPSITFGSKNSSHAASGEIKQLTACLEEIPYAIKKTPTLYLVQGDCELAADSLYHGSLIVTGKLTVGRRATVIGDIKARKGLKVMQGAQVKGAVTCNKNIQVFSDASLLGPLLSERDIALDMNAVIGLPEAPTSVSARNILVTQGVIVHGSIWAHDIGMVRST